MRVFTIACSCSMSAAGVPAAKHYQLRHSCPLPKSQSDRQILCQLFKEVDFYLILNHSILTTFLSVHAVVRLMPPPPALQNTSTMSLWNRLYIEMDFGACLENVGSFGTYQKVLSFVFVTFTTFTCGANYYTQVWHLLWCRWRLHHFLMINSNQFKLV